ncbi:LacI family DNA-binding transcriptional regulator [Parendozoicomonas haliclonae]|uniref:HTH-type transcriptional repressor PurR n=1 Tax=Parendozoicomonas haliclonae TaxID=1960125 RepID=A0A1X7AII3_9GAMM|nr:LacI family DNA-binding transcriptional regulator [Parendozoicomonas haliclonae]SMA44014.1 HTH-type transcriptional repressor PurR [Parendozoicomonas haliclonae]
MSKRKSAGQSTILQVAAQAGLSIATVSRVLNGGKYVAESTREKVLQAAAELNYQPNYMARQLHGMDDFVVAVILGMDLGTISPFALKVYEVLKGELQKQGYRVKRAQFSPDGELLTAARAYVGIGLHYSDARYQEVMSQEEPFVAIGDVQKDGYWVASNDHQGGYLSTRHLLDNGCRTIYYVCLHSDHEVSALRYQGYREAMHDAGLIPSEAIEIVTDTGLPALDSYRRIRGLLESGLRPDAFVAFSDIVAAGISMALADTGRKVPEDVQVVGYDGIDDDRYHSLTTIRQDIEGIAAQATALVMDAIKKEAPRGSYLDVILRPGQTTRLIC